MHFDSNLSMETHVNSLCRSLYLELRRIGQIRDYLTIEAAKTLVCSMIFSRLDYCNSLLFGITETRISKLQRIQNCAARLVLRRSRHHESCSLLKELHWLPVHARIEYKIATIVYKSLHDSKFPSYLSELIVPCNPTRSLRSEMFNILFRPRTNLKTYGERAFTHTGPTVWNSLPEHVKISNSIDAFKKSLKTYLFNKYFK